MSKFQMSSNVMETPLNTPNDPNQSGLLRALMIGVSASSIVKGGLDAILLSYSAMRNLWVMFLVDRLFAENGFSSLF